jgi:hypothetical protein
MDCIDLNLFALAHETNEFVSTLSSWLNGALETGKSGPSSSHHGCVIGCERGRAQAHETRAAASSSAARRARDFVGLKTRTVRISPISDFQWISCGFPLDF